MAQVANSKIAQSCTKTNTSKEIALYTRDSSYLNLVKSEHKHRNPVP